MDQDCCFIILKEELQHEQIQCPPSLDYEYISEIIKSYTYSAVLELWKERDFNRIRVYGDPAIMIFMK